MLDQSESNKFTINLLCELCGGIVHSKNTRNTIEFYMAAAIIDPSFFLKLKFYNHLLISDVRVFIVLGVIIVVGM